MYADVVLLINESQFRLLQCIECLSDVLIAYIFNLALIVHFNKNNSITCFLNEIVESNHSCATTLAFALRFYG